jgi:DNA repair exonuclease SbcCD nuclease subunit
MKITGPKVCCISDLHIGVHQDSIMWHNIILNWAEWLKQDLINKKITDIVISGDVFHDRNEISVNTLHVANRFFKVFEKFNIYVLIGNHDIYYHNRTDVNSLSIFDSWSNIKIIPELETEIINEKTISFCPWNTDVEKIPQSDIIFGHFEIVSFKNTKNKVCEEGTKTKDLLAKSPLTISGHFHMKDERIYDQGTILYIGSPYELDWGDHGVTKGYYILDLDTSEYEFIENTVSPKHQKIRFSELKRAKQITSEIKDMFKGNIVNFIIDEDVDLDMIDKFVKNLGALHPLSLNTDFDNNSEYSLADDYDIAIEGIDISIAIKEFVGMLEIENNKQEVLDYVLNLYKRFEK